MTPIAGILLSAPRGTQTVVAVLVGAALLVSSALAPPWRRRASPVLLAVLLAAMVFVRLRLPVPEGDFPTYTASTGAFREYLNVSGHVEFQSHLGSTIVGQAFRLLGSDAGAMRGAFTLYASLASVLYVVAMALVGFLERWSPAAVRYLALAALAPPVLLFFGYRELGYEPLAPALLAFPLLITGLERSSAWRVRAGGALFGLAAALHGYALFALLTGILVAAFAAGPYGRRVRDAFDVAAYGIAVYLLWIPLYVIVERATVMPGHAGDLAFRPLFHTVVSQSRLDHPVFSIAAGVPILLMLAVGGPVLYVSAASVRGFADRNRLLLATVPILIFYVLFWPVQGIGNDTDLAVGTFGALFLLAWTSARTRRSSLVAGALLVCGHPLFWFLATSRFVVHPFH